MLGFHFCWYEVAKLPSRRTGAFAAQAAGSDYAEPGGVELGAAEPDVAAFGASEPGAAESGAEMSVIGGVGRVPSDADG